MFKIPTHQSLVRRLGVTGPFPPNDGHRSAPIEVLIALKVRAVEFESFVQCLVEPTQWLCIIDELGLNEAKLIGDHADGIYHQGRLGSG